MARLYGQVRGRTRSKATRCGNNSLFVVAQAWEGSVSVELSFYSDGTPRVTLAVDKGSTSNPKNIFWDGPLVALVNGKILPYSHQVNEGWTYEEEA